MRKRFPSVAAALGAVALAIAACKSTPTNTNNCGSGAAPSLVGTYVLASYQFGTQTWTAPTSTGSLHLTAATYSYTMLLATDTTPLTVSGAGNYVIVGASCIMQTSTVDTTHFSASFVLQTVAGVTTLRESGSDGTHEVIWLWTKQ
ncbi:MAG TPA: hypothetical protein VEH83_08530 [Gemmatimonadales bacterium]|nr:hypothetical protein [Gemmatimonadales bacterium]